MPYYHATWRRHLPSIMSKGLGGAEPDKRNFPVEPGVYLSVRADVAIMMLIEAYVGFGKDSGLKPADAIDAICVIVVDDARLDQRFIDIDPNIERQDVTVLYRGVIDVRGLPVLSVNTVMASET